MLISERIFCCLNEKSISQKEFSFRTGISQSTISDWKRKKTNPSADKIMIICEVLGMSPQELLLGTEHKMNKQHNEPDYIVIDKNSSEYSFIEMYQQLKSDERNRLEGYMIALLEHKNK